MTMYSWMILVADLVAPLRLKTRPRAASFLFVGAVFATLLTICGCEPAVREVAFAGSTMGTTYHVKVVTKGSELPQDIAVQVQSAVDAVDLSMSTYKPDSELNRLNRHPVGEAFPVSADLWAVLDISATVYTLTGGAFDPTVAPLVDVWGFGPIDTGDRIPSDVEIETLVTQIGLDKLVRDPARRTVLKTSTLQLDLSAVAKGYAADKVADLLREYGIDRYMIEIGGELALAGLNSAGEPWRIAIETPTLLQGDVQKIVAVTDCGMATSGDYRNYFEKDGRRYSHTIDPRTGKPITHRLASVTVIAETSALADALATGFDVLGAERALIVANELGVPVFLLVRGEDAFEERYNQAFAAYLKAGNGLEK